jgi:hypothetical protein
MKKLSLLILSACALLGSRAQAAPDAQAPLGGPAPLGVQTAGSSDQASADLLVPGLLVSGPVVSGRDWLLKAADNVCGLRDPNQLTYPALIDFEACLEATPEMRRVRDQGIDPKGAEGIQLRSAAVSRLTNACESVRATNGHCSVWKAIRHKDGRSIPDVSSQVIALF